MSKVFEDYFTELQADMVSICLEYIGNKGDYIYIYCSYEKKISSVGYFYKINGKLKERHKVNEELLNCDVSINRQKATMQIIMEDLGKIKTLCAEFDRLMPTEMKLTYNIKENSLSAKYQYEAVYTHDSKKSADDIENEWFNQLAKENVQK